MWFQLQEISKIYQSTNFFNSVMDYISKYYTLRFSSDEHLQVLRELYPDTFSNDECLNGDDANHSQIIKLMCNLIDTPADQKKKMLEHPFPQDRIQSTAEVDYIKENIVFNKIDCIIEIGAGYGRIPEHLERTGQIKKYIIVDIPPALWVSQTYLKKQFPNLKIAAFQKDMDENKFKILYKENQILFMAPSQIKFIDKSISSIAIALNCLQEMPSETIEYFFEQLSFVSKYFYLKTQNSPHNPWSDPLLGFDDIMSMQSWETVDHRNVIFPSNYSEGLLKSLN